MVRRYRREICLRSDALYRVESYSGVKHDLKKLDKRLRELILERDYSIIAEDPYCASPLSHQLKGLWSYHVNYHGSEYRIVCEIDSDTETVLVIMIGSREGFYTALRRRVKG